MAAITATNLATSLTTTPATSFTTASITPTANTLVLAFVASEIDGGDPAQPTVSGNSLTWVEVATVQGRLIAGHRQYRGTIYRAMGSSPSTGSITIDFSGVSQNIASWSVAEFANTNTSGTNGSGAIVQSGSAATTASEASLTVTLSAFSDVNNAGYGGTFWHTGGSPTITAGSGFTEIAESSSGGAVVQSEFQAATDNTVDVSCSTTDGGILLALELKNATQVSGNNAALMAMLSF